MTVDSREYQQYYQSKEGSMEVIHVTLGNSDLGISWGDGHESIYTNKYLRGHCGCAVCVEEMTGRRIISEDNIQQDIQALDWIQVGRYALQFLWSDTHDTGIYPFELLRNLCACKDCGSAKDG
jgi:DUF971 family protein